MSKNQPTNAVLAEIQNNLSNLIQNPTLQQELGGEFDLVQENIDQMNQGIQMIDNNDNIPDEQKIGKKADIIKDTIETLATLNDAVLNNDTLKSSLYKANDDLTSEIMQGTIQIPQPPSMQGADIRLSEDKEKQIEKQLANLQVALEELASSKEVQQDKELSSRLQGPIKVMNKGLEAYGDMGVNAQSKNMLNAIDSMSAIIKEHEQKTKTKINVGSEIASIGNTIREVRKENGLPEHQTASQNKKPLSQEQINEQKESIKNAASAVNNLDLDKESLGSKNHEKISKMVADMNKSLANLDKLHKEGKISEEHLLKNKQGYVIGTINQINDHLDNFDKALDKQQGKNNFARVKNILKAAAKVVLTLGSKEAKMELAAAQFQRKEKVMKGGFVAVSDDGKTKAQTFKASKTSMVEKLKQARNDSKGISR